MRVNALQNRIGADEKSADISVGAEMPASGPAGDSEFDHSRLQGGPFHAKQRCSPGRTGNDPIGFFECAQDVVSFCGLEGCHGWMPITHPRLQFKERNAQVGPLRQNHSAFDEIFQFSDIARPVITAESIHGI